MKYLNERADELINNINSTVEFMQKMCNTIKHTNEKIEESCKAFEFYSMPMFGADISFNCEKNNTGDDYFMDHSVGWKLLKEVFEELRTVESKVRFLAGMQWSVTSASDEIANELDELEEFGN